MKRMTALLLAVVLVFALCACGAKTDGGQTASGGKVLNVAASFAYPSLDAHKEYYGWYTSIYGVTEALFKMGDDSTAQPCLAADASADGKTWTITLRDGICFSNGGAVTAEMVARNLQRAAEVNERFAFLADYTITATDEKTLTITTPEISPTLKNDLASPELGILDLDNTADFDNAPVGTGPFVITSFEPEGTVQVARNDNYWGGDVTLDGAVFYYMQDDDTKLMAMQNGEVDCCTGVSAAAVAVFEREPDTYRIVSVPATRLQFYILNENRLDDAVRAAVNLTVDRDAIAAYLNGTVTAANGPFGAATAYGKVTVPAVDTDRTKALLEADGYTMNADGVYEKNGRELSLNIAYYAARSLDTLATLIQEQLKNVGIAATLTVAEDPDSTYIATADFDLALYCMIADKSGDPYYFIDSTLRNGAYFNVGGFESSECEALIDQLRYETDTSRRAALANEIVQLAIDDNAFGYVGLFNKTTVLRPGVSGFAETCPFDFYGIDAHTDKT